MHGLQLIALVELVATNVFSKLVAEATSDTIEEASIVYGRQTFEIGSGSRTEAIIYLVAGCPQLHNQKGQL
jgi:hypothetical protein